MVKTVTKTRQISGVFSFPVTELISFGAAIIPLMIYNRKSKNKLPSRIIDRFCHFISTANCSVKCHNRGDCIVNFSVDFSLSAFMLPAGSVLTKILSIFQRSTGEPPCATRCSSVGFISSNLLPAHVPFVWQRLSINATTKFALSSS